MEPTSLPLFFFLLFCSLIHHVAAASRISSSPPTAQPTAADAGQQDPSPVSSRPLKDLCAKLTHPDLCMSSIQPLAQGATSMDVPTALKFEIDALAAAFLTTKKMRDDLQSSGKEYSSGTQICLMGLFDAKTDIENAVSAMRGADMGLVGSSLETFADNIEYCKDESVEKDLVAEAEKISQLLDNCSSIYDIILPKAPA